MTKALYQSMSVFLGVIAIAVFFVMQPSDDVEVQSFQADIRQMFVQATKELVGDQSFTEPFAMIWTVADNFYKQSADQAIALIQPTDEIVELSLALDSDYQVAKANYSAPLVMRAPFEEPISLVSLSRPAPQEELAVNDDPESVLDPKFDEDLAYVEEFGGKIAGESVDVGPQDPKAHSQWLDLTDSITGEAYCVAIFYGTVNTYPGACAKEEEQTVIYAN
jgi:hypothetical protein